MGSKNTVIGVVLVVVIVAAVVILAKRTNLIGHEQAKAWVGAQKLQMIDTKTATFITRTRDEWEKLGHDDAGRYRNPDTKDYTMVFPQKCNSCGELSVPVEYPADVLALKSGTPERDAAEAKARSAYLCPKCKQPAYPREAVP